MTIFLKKYRNECIESLEFCYFLQKLYSSLVSELYNQKVENQLIFGFLDIIRDFYQWEFKKIYPYIQTLKDQVFWSSSKFYFETMQKLVDGESNALEFAQEFSDRLLLDKQKANNLVEDYKQQADIELNSNIFKFSEIIIGFEIPLEVYQNEAEELSEGEISEDELSFPESSIIEAVKLALEKINPYFMD